MSLIWCIWHSAAVRPAGTPAGPATARVLAWGPPGPTRGVPTGSAAGWGGGEVGGDDVEGPYGSVGGGEVDFDEVPPVPTSFVPSRGEKSEQ